MRHIFVSVLAVALLASAATSVMAQGSGQFCLRIDQKENCSFPTMDACNSIALNQGGYCTENYRLYGNKGAKRYCLATRYGTSCIYNDRRRCVNAAGALGDEGAACVDNYALSERERLKLESQGASDCAETDFACQAGL